MPPQTPSGLRAWLLARALPLWLDHGVDRARGGFHEELAHDGYTCDAPFRRLRVLARQIIAFSHAHRNGVPGAAEAVAMGVHTLARRAALPDGGYAWRFDLAHAPIDTTRDLYDHAFVLLALAEATAVLPASSLRAPALALLGFLDTHMAHPAGGYREALSSVQPSASQPSASQPSAPRPSASQPAAPRRQNPHMHLLEALLAAHAAFPDPVFLERAHALVSLFTGRLLDPATGALPEFYDEALHPLTTGGLFQTEPGHHCEWAWLLHDYARHAGPDPHRAAIAARLLGFVDAHASHPATHDLIDCLASNGAPLARSARLWPQAERLKTAFLRPDRTPAHQQVALASLSAYLRPDGLWHDRRDPDGAFIAGPAPASSLYHLTTAILIADASAAGASPDNPSGG